MTSNHERLFDLPDAELIALVDQPPTWQGPPNLTDCITPPDELTEEQWAETYRPIRNPYDPNASWDGLMFETYGAELDDVHATPVERVWTYLEGENGTYLVSGYHWVNRIGHFICEEPWTENRITVQVSWDIVTCDACDAQHYNEESPLSHCTECGNCIGACCTC